MVGDKMGWTPCSCPISDLRSPASGRTREGARRVRPMSSGRIRRESRPALTDRVSEASLDGEPADSEDMTNALGSWNVEVRVRPAGDRAERLAAEEGTPVRRAPLLRTPAVASKAGNPGAPAKGAKPSEHPREPLEAGAPSDRLPSAGPTSREPRVRSGRKRARRRSTSFAASRETACPRHAGPPSSPAPAWRADRPHRTEMDDETPRRRYRGTTARGDARGVCGPSPANTRPIRALRGTATQREDGMTEYTTHSRPRAAPLQPTQEY